MPKSEINLREKLEDMELTYSTPRICLYLFYRTKVVANSEKEKKKIVHHKEKAAIFNAHVLITRENMRSKDAQCKTWECL